MYYKSDNGELLQGNSVLNVEYKLEENKQESYIFPIDGWYWFENEDDARTFFNIPKVDNSIGEDYGL